MKTKTIPFDLETAIEIQKGKIKGKIKTNQGKEAHIICTDKASTDEDNRTQIVCLIRLGTKELVSINDPKTGECWDVEDGKPQHLVLEVPDNEPQFKPFDKVLVTQDGWGYWIPSLYRNETPDGKHICIDNLEYDQCIPYEGNQELVGTCNEPKCK